MSFSDLRLFADLPWTEDWRSLLASGIPLLDVRAPVEYAAGALPNTYNLPLLNDTEREQIGGCYKQWGQDAAIELGLRLINGSARKMRVDSWQEFIENHPQSALFKKSH